MAENQDEGQERRPSAEERALAELERTDLSLLVLLRDQVQKLRIAEGNRSGAAAKREEEDRQQLHGRYARLLGEIEEDVEKRLKPEVEQHPAWPWLGQIRGVSHTSAALVLGYIDIERSPTVSSLWRYAGFGVVNGKRERPTKGQKLAYNARLKTMVWRLTDLQVKLRGPFRGAYDDAKHRYLTTRGPESGFKAEDTDKPWTLGHCEAASRRKASKLFLAMLWQVWREADGLSVRGPWIEQYGGDQHSILDPWDYIGAKRP